MIISVIVACEVAFWIAIAAGLALRYLARRPRLGLTVLALVPVIDVVLLVAVAANLHSGGTATVTHSIATFYLGFSLAYGHRMIAWADVRFAHRFAGGPAPVRPTGAAYTRQCWADVLPTGLACALAAGITWALITWTSDPARTNALRTTYSWALILPGIDLLWALSYTLWPRREPASTPTGRNHRSDTP